MLTSKKAFPHERATPPERRQTSRATNEPAPSPARALKKVAASRATTTNHGSRARTNHLGRFVTTSEDLSRKHRPITSLARVPPSPATCQNRRPPPRAAGTRARDTTGDATESSPATSTPSRTGRACLAVRGGLACGHESPHTMHNLRVNYGQGTTMHTHAHKHCLRFSSLPIEDAHRNNERLERGQGPPEIQAELIFRYLPGRDGDTDGRARAREEEDG